MKSMTDRQPEFEFRQEMSALCRMEEVTNLTKDSKNLPRGESSTGTSSAGSGEPGGSGIGALVFGFGVSALNGTRSTGLS